MIRLWLLVTSIAVAAAPSMSQVSCRPVPESVETHARVRVDGAVEKAQLVFQPKPKYPPDAAKAGVQGRVRLEAVVGKNGSIKKVKVISGEPVLVKAAIEAVSRWRYKPTLVAGKPVEVETEIDVIFKLRKQRP
jgi:protein TonB